MTKQNSESNFKNRISHRLLGIILMIVGGLIIAAIIFFLFLKFFSAPRVAKLLPQNDTVALMEFDLGPFNGQFQKFRELTRGHSAYSEDKLVSFLSENMGLDFYEDVEPWMGSRFGIGLLQNDPKTSAIHEVYFIETSDKEKTMEMMKKFQLTHPDDRLTMKRFGGYEVHSYKLASNINFFFARNYLIFSGSNAPLQKVISVLNGELKSVDKSKNYSTIVTNTDKNYLAFGYINIQNGLEKIARNPRYVRLVGGELSLFMPLLKLYQNAGVSLTTTDTGLRLQTYTAIDKNALKRGAYFSYSKNYQGQLLGLKEKATLATFGGHNFGGQIKRFQEVLEETNSRAGLVFKGEVNNLLKGYLGGEFISADEILSYLKNEYLVLVEGSLIAPDYYLVVELDDQKEITPLLPALNEAFIKYSAQRNPIVRDITLEDGTEAQEVVIDKNSIKKTQVTVYDGKMITYNTNEGKNLLSYAIKDNYFVVGHTRETITRIMEFLDEGKRSETIFDTAQGEDLLTASDEVAVVDLKAIWPVAKFVSPDLIQYMLPFQKMYFGKQIFDNGVVSEYYLDIL